MFKALVKEFKQINTVPGWKNLQTNLFEILSRLVKKSRATDSFCLFLVKACSLHSSRVSVRLYT